MGCLKVAVLISDSSKVQTLGKWVCKFESSKLKKELFMALTLRIVLLENGRK